MGDGHFAHRNDWILLLDADEMLTPELALRIRAAIQNPSTERILHLIRKPGFWGAPLRHGDIGLWKLALFRRGKATV